jgi:hypothetical protein
MSGESRRAGTTILTNKANFQKGKMNAKSIIIRAYEEKTQFWLEKNKVNFCIGCTGSLFIIAGFCKKGRYKNASLAACWPLRDNP